ncbi:MAG: peptidoglycan-binding domain-containing protein [Pseudomonadota bacterium]
MKKSVLIFAAVATVLAGCLAEPVTRADVSSIAPLDTAPVISAETGTCFSRATTPAVIETVTEQILVQPATIRSDGSVETPAAFRTVTRQRIVRERREVEFETPCPDVLTPSFVASVQRALRARGYYRGAISGEMDGTTQSAIRAFQVAMDDIDTGTLTLRASRALGLVAVPRESL